MWRKALDDARCRPDRGRYWSALETATATAEGGGTASKGVLWFTAEGGIITSRGVL